jgi:L-ectoine synthase
MFVRTYADLEPQGRVLSLVNDTTRSARFLTAADGLGFSYNENRVSKGSEAVLWYRNHWEANYIVSGRAAVTDLTTGEAWELDPGDVYIVGPNDRHIFKVLDDEHHISVFCPPLRGDERHDAEGTYPPNGPAPVTDRRMFVKRGAEMRAAGQELVAANGQARTLRMVTKADDLGFGFSDVHFDAGAEAVLWYKNHWEANHVLAGEGDVTDLTTGESWKLGPGVAYNVGPKDRHRLRVFAPMHLVSVFNPPLEGHEMHDADGALAPSGPVPPGPPGY